MERRHIPREELAAAGTFLLANRYGKSADNMGRCAPRNLVWNRSRAPPVVDVAEAKKIIRGAGSEVRELINRMKIRTRNVVFILKVRAGQGEEISSNDV